MKAILTPCILTSIRSRADGSIGLSFVTPELNSAERVAFFDLLNMNTKMLLAPIEDDAPPVEVKSKMEHKTPSQQLRAVLFVFWRQEGSVGDFEAFYRAKISQFVESVKSKLDQ